jgi:acylaminoacyl-peptidase
MLLPRRFWGALLLLNTAMSPMLATASAETKQTAASYFQAEDIFALEYASDPQVSPDGRTVVYVRQSNDIMTDDSRGSLWLIDVKTAQQWPLFDDQFQYSQPRWSADGSQLAFVSDRSGSRQIHLHWLQQNRTAQLSQLAGSPANLTWSPDGRQLAFSMNVAAGPAKVSTLVKMPKKPAKAHWSEPAVVIDRADYQADGQGFLSSSYRQLFILPATGGKERQLTFAERHHGADLLFSPDGQSLIFSANLAADFEYQPRDKDLYQLKLSDLSQQQLTQLPGLEEKASFSPDGQRLAFIWGHNEKVPFANGKVKVLTLKTGQIEAIAADADLDIAALDWLDNRQLLVQYDERGLRKLATLSLAGKFNVLTDRLSGTGLPQPYLSGEFHQQNGVIAFTDGDASRPADIAIWQQGKSRVVTALNADLLAHKKLAQVHEMNYTSSFDQEPMQGWYLTPPDFDPAKKYPLLLEIHGGPHLAYGPHFSAEMQRYAAEGYVVFYANHRGSTSYGERFALLLHGKYSSKEDFADHNSGVDAMLQLGFIDSNNLFIAGGSAGGIATAYAIGLTDRFKAAAVVKPVINWLSKVLTGDSYLYQTYFQFPGVPWEHMEHYWQRSPLSLVGNVKTPTILITGEADRRTPISESEQFYQALKLRKIDTAMVRIPGAPHGIANKPSRMISKVEHMLAWFRLYRTDLNHN